MSYGQSIGYGEDALTYWALTRRVPQIMHLLTDESDVLFRFVRPSFGRGAWPQFGESDKIIGTAKATYNFENKWLGRNVGRLRKAQLRRHQIFRTYFECWRDLKPRRWVDFTRHQTVLKAFERYPGYLFPNQQTILARNIEFVLKSLESCGPLVDVFMHFHRRGTEPEPGPPHFRSIAMEYDGISNTDFFDMEA